MEQLWVPLLARPAVFSQRFSHCWASQQWHSSVFQQAAKAEQAALPHWKDRFKFKKALGRGGFGRVGLFYDSVCERDVAIKLPREPDDTRMVEALAEVRRSCSVSSSRLIQIHDVGWLWDDEPFLCEDAACIHSPDERPAIVMEFAERGRLSEGVGGAPWHVRNVAEKFPVIVQGVADIHAANLAHLDLKPANIMFGRDGLPRITDLGLGRAWLEAAPERLAGTRPWMTPEFLSAHLSDQLVSPDPKFDVWALGVILYELLTGQHPFDWNRHADWQNRIQTATVDRASEINPGLDNRWNQLFEDCFHRIPGHRLQTPGDLLRAFEEKLDQINGRRPAGRSMPDEIAASAGGSGNPPGSGNGDDGANNPPPDSSGPTSSGPGDSPGNSGFDRRAAELFVGRDELLKDLDEFFGDLDDNAPLLEPDDPALVAYLHAMPGSGKTYLIDRWLFLRQERAKDAGLADSSSRVVDLPLDRNRRKPVGRTEERSDDVPATGNKASDRDRRSGAALDPAYESGGYSADDLRNELVAKLRLDGPDAEAALRVALSHRFLRIENVDSPEFAHAVAELAKSLDGCRLIVSGRWFAEGSVPKRWRQQAVPMLTLEQAAQQLAQEVGEDFWQNLSDDQREALVLRTARLPLAIHLTAGFLLKGMSVEKLLDRLPHLTLQDAEDPRFGQSVLKIMFDELWKSLDQTLRSQPWLNADDLLTGFQRLGFAHPAGVGRSLASALSGLSAEDLDDLLVEAATLHLVEREPDSNRFRLHPLIAEQLTANVDRSPVDEAVTDWFCERLPEPDDQSVHNTAWHEIHTEFDTLVSWLEALPAHDVHRVLRFGDDHFGHFNGPFRSWIAICERGRGSQESEEERSVRLSSAAWFCLSAGENNQALAMATEKLVCETDRQNHQEIGEAAKLLGDAHAAQGRLEEAMNAWSEIALPASRVAGQVRDVAILQGRIADVLEARGELDEALCIRREEELPVYERLGDVRGKAVTQGQIADVLQARGELDEALRIRREEQLPVYERLGATLDLVFGWWYLAENLLERNAPGDRNEAAELLRLAHAVAEKMGIPEAGQIREIQEDEGLEF